MACPPAAVDTGAAGVRELRQAPWLAVVSVCFGAFMGQLDASIVTVAFPDMSRSLHAPVAAVRRAALAYMVTVVALLAAVGRVSDALGRKLIRVRGVHCGVGRVRAGGAGLAAPRATPAGRDQGCDPVPREHRAERLTDHVAAS